MTTNTTAEPQYEVEKFARGEGGKWFGFGARRFLGRRAAEEYFARFAAEQAAVLSAGVRIDLRARTGRRVVAVVGGLLDHARCREVRSVE